MDVEFSELDGSHDPLGFDIFVSIEVFEETMSSLAGLYFQLWFSEQQNKQAFTRATQDQFDFYINGKKQW